MFLDYFYILIIVSFSNRIYLSHQKIGGFRTSIMLCPMINLLLRKSLKQLNQVICQEYTFIVNTQKIFNQNYQYTCEIMHYAQASGLLSALVYAHAFVLVSLSPKASPSKEKIWLAVRHWG